MGTLVTDLSLAEALALFSASPSGAMMCALGKAADQDERKMWCSRSGAAMYRTVPMDVSLDCTVGVRATGEKMAREPLRSFTGLDVRCRFGEIGIGEDGKRRGNYQLFLDHQI